MLDFLELKDTYSEKELESALLREMGRFLLERYGFGVRRAAEAQTSMGTTTTLTFSPSTGRCVDSSSTCAEAVRYESSLRRARSASLRASWCTDTQVATSRDLVPTGTSRNQARRTRVRIVQRWSCCYAWCRECV